MAQKQQEQERKTFVTIRHGNKKIKLETWRYWEIVGELQFMGAGRCDAVDAARWAMRAETGETLSILYYRPILNSKMETSNEIIKPGEIKMEVTNG